MSETIIGKILVVDDEIELKNALVEALSAQNFDVAGFTSQVTALETLRTQSFDVLLSDLMMPEMGGIQLVKEALNIDPNIIAIIMTGQGTIQTAVDAMKAGTFDYVLKPFRLQAVMPVLTRAINTRRLRFMNSARRSRSHSTHRRSSASWLTLRCSKRKLMRCPCSCQLGRAMNSTLRPCEVRTGKGCWESECHFRLAFRAG